MPREVTDEEGTAWNCVQAYAGLKADGGEKPDAEQQAQAAARAADGEGLVEVIATPTGGAQTVRMELKRDWEESVSDEELLGLIKEKQRDAEE